MDAVVRNLQFARRFVVAYEAERAESANAEQAGRLSPAEKRIAFMQLSPADRREAIENRTAELLADRDAIGGFLMELMSGPLADQVAICVRDAIPEAGHCWDAIHTLGDLLHSAARKRAAKELK